MQPSPRSAFRLGVLTVLVLACGGPAPPSDPAGAKVLTVCALPAAMPRTGRAPDGTTQGLDTRVAALVARELGRKVEFHWCASADCGWTCLAEGRCDVVAGQPRDSGPPRDVAWSVPYAGARLGLVVPDGSRQVGSLADLHGKRLGIVSGTVSLAEKDHVLVRFKNGDELLDGFQKAALDGAFLDADFAAWSLHERPRPGLRLVEGYVPRERWNLALAVRGGDSGLLVGINRALARLAESGGVRAVYSERGVPFRPPFTATGSRPSAPDTWRRVVARGELVVSADPANLPYSSARDERPGFEIELARELAKRLGVKLRIEWLDTLRESAVGHLLDRRCDLVLGEAVDENSVADDEPLAGQVLYSRPYYGTGYVLVRRKNGPEARSLADVKARSRRIGTEAGSVADYRLRQRGHDRQLLRNQLATLKALNDGQIDFAYLWANVGWTLHASPDFALELVDGYVPEDPWNVAVAMCRGDNELKMRVDAALDGMIKDGTVASTLSRYHMPIHAPFPEPGSRASPLAGFPPLGGGIEGGSGANRPDPKVPPPNPPFARGGVLVDAPKDDAAGGAIRHQVADRGPEPRMEKVQTSKHAYTGLARIRSAGELVVGLDPNNLPFSTAHPEPSGLDHEIAGLLAEQLGVSLRVYWAYSAHDSYPSKLASKHLCDVILGVSPDDRFAQRVAYSRPYYVASYRPVVRDGDPAPSATEPLAVEEGVAVRGLAGREAKSYPSTDAILDAVATGRIRAGYVISTRGPWLADQRWHDQLAFLPAFNRVDALPICAAVRKTDGDLKDAIDRAWDELARTGRLSRVFARWHVLDDTVAAPDSRNRP